MKRKKGGGDTAEPADGPGSRSIAGKAYQRLRLAVVECRLAPGQRLTEASIAALFKVGKTPAREALRRLVLEGLARVTPRHGYTVAPITLRDVQELFELRLLLEPEAAALAAGRLDNSSLQRLRELSRVGYVPKGRLSMRKFLRVNSDLHARIAHGSGNRRVARLVSQLLAESERLVNFGMSVYPQSEQTVEGHLVLVQALAAGDAGAARSLAAEHIQATRVMVVESLITGTRLREVSIPRADLRPSKPGRM